MRRIALVLAAGLVIASVMPLPHAAGRPRRGLAAEPFTVIAVVDSGIDPYHLDFRHPELTAHPSTYVEGFPKDAPALRLSFDEPTYPAAAKADEERWKRVEQNRLYWIPGTNIIGAIGPLDSLAILGPEDDVSGGGEETFRDTLGHGTSVASLAGGAIHGPSGNRTLIVAVQGFEEGVRWAAQQPWIDVITNSWWNVEADDFAKGAKASRLAVRNGKVVCFASGNFSHPQLYTSTQGPSWSVNVGAASANTRGEHYYTNYPNDVLGLAGVPAAEMGTFDGEVDFAGTSAAAPNVCGLFAKTISEVRAILRDPSQGSRGGFARGARGRGYLDDGRLTREELEDALQSTATPAASDVDPGDPGSLPALPVAPFLRGGYGIVDEDSAAAALEVIVGAEPRPERALEDAWIQATDALREAIWGSLAP